MSVGVHAYLRSPVALVWTLLGTIAVGGVVVAALGIGTLAGRSTLVADPTAPVGPGGFLLTLAFAIATAAVAAVVWLPCSLAISYAVGERVRNGPVSFGGSIELLRSRAEPLYRWVKTRVAVEPVADRLLTDEDVSPAEVAVGCDAFVVPALALDAPTIRAAVGRANRAIPRSGRERLLVAGLGATGIFVGGILTAGAVGETALPSTDSLALGVAVFGAVVTAALDTAWRAGTYARQDLEEGFA